MLSKKAFTHATDYLSLEGEGGTKYRVRGKVNKVAIVSQVLPDNVPAKGHTFSFKKCVILDLIQDLQRLPLSFINNLRGRCQIKFGMTPLYNNGAFTLLELLVVVLIIGILTAVAVPQYRKSVERSQAATAKVLLRDIYEANRIFKQETGESFSSFSQLPLDIPGTFHDFKGGSGLRETYDLGQWRLELHGGAWGMGKMIQTRRMQGPYKGIVLWAFLDTYPFKVLCRKTDGTPAYQGNIEDYCQKILGGTFWWADKYDIP